MRVDGGKRGERIGAQTHRRGVVRGGRVEARDWRQDVMERGSGEKAAFPAGREDQFGKAGNGWVAVILGVR